jgi:hypothetical protein
MTGQGDGRSNQFFCGGLISNYWLCSLVRGKPFEEHPLEHEDWFHNLREIRDIGRIEKGYGEGSSLQN